MGQHSTAFLTLVDDAKTRIKEMSIAEFQTLKGQPCALIDVREESEWAKGHLPDAKYLGRGILERDIEAKIPEKNTLIVLYCGGGYRSALAAESLQKMGYQNVYSLAGGYRDWKEANLPIDTSNGMNS